MTLDCKADMASRLTKLEHLQDPKTANADNFVQLYNKVFQTETQKSTDFPDATTPLLISRDRVNALHKDEGNSLAFTIKDITDQMINAKGHNLSMQIVYLYAHGIMCVNPVLVDHAGGLSEPNQAIIICLVCAGAAGFGSRNPIGAVVGLGVWAIACEYILPEQDIVRSVRYLLTVSGQSLFS